MYDRYTIHLCRYRTKKLENHRLIVICINLQFRIRVFESKYLWILYL
jgi:hypothetical protein